MATALVLTAAFAMVFFYAPLDADQGFVQKIFYVHVPMAIVALGGWGAGGIFGGRPPRPGGRARARVQKTSYVPVPMALVALGGWVAGGIFGIRHLRSGDPSWDLRSYVAI